MTHVPSARSTQPVEIELSQLGELKQSEAALTKDAKELLADWALPLTFEKIPVDELRNDNGGSRVASGIFWIPGPFAHDFWSKARKKPKPTKCQCACGHKHTAKGEPNHA